MTRYLVLQPYCDRRGPLRPDQPNVPSEHGTVAEAFREADRLAAASKGEIWIVVTDEERLPVARPAVTVQ